MRKKISLIFLLLFILGFTAAAVAAENYLSTIQKSGGEKPAENVKGWKQPDLDNLSFYGISPFKTALPVLYIDTEGKLITKENPIRASIAVSEASDTGERSVLDRPDYSESISLKYRGASSLAFDKRQYRIKFYRSADSTKEKDIAFLGMGENSEWVLNGPFLDKTLMRNHLVYTLAREMMEWAPDHRYVELFVDGKYQGLYLAVEPVTNGSSRLRLSKFSLLSGESAYIVKRDRIGTEGEALKVYGKEYGYTNNDLFLVYPSEKRVTDEQKLWITQDISQFEKALYGPSFKDPLKGYARYIDMTNFADYYVLNEVVMNEDIGNLSMFAYKELGGKLKTAVWDYNNCYDNYQWFSQSTSEFYGANHSWFSRMLQDRQFADLVIERYQLLRKTTLSEEHMLSVLQESEDSLKPAIERNFKVWGYSFDLNLLTGRDRDLKSHEEAMQQLRSEIHARFAFLDQHITDIYQYCI